jgi:hypothetical protein
MLLAFDWFSKESKCLSQLKRITCCFPDLTCPSKIIISFSEKRLSRTIQDNQLGMGQKVDGHHLWDVSGKTFTVFKWVPLNVITDNVINWLKQSS